MTKGNKGKNPAHHGGKSKEQVERKRDERARRNALRKEREAKEYLENDENFVSFSNQLQALGYKIKDIKGDGNCLFRALADQMDGGDDGHLRYRRTIVKYLADHRDEFEPFVEDNKSFDEHVKELSKAGTFGGNDSIVAFSRCFGINVVIHQLNERCWVISGDEFRKPGEPSKELHISYHNGDHYSSVRRIGDPDEGPAWLFNNQHKVTKGKVSCDGKTPKHEKTKKSAAVYDQAMAPDESSDLAIIQAATGCQDMELIQQTLLESNHDLDSTISYILQLQSLTTMEDSTEGLASTANHEHEVDNEGNGQDKNLPDLIQEGSTSYCDGNSLKPQSAEQHETMPQARGGAIPKTKQQVAKSKSTPSNRKRKNLAKQDKKARRMEERREEMKNKGKQNEHEKQNVQTNNATMVVPVVLDLEALSI